MNEFKGAHTVVGQLGRVKPISYSADKSNVATKINFEKFLVDERILTSETLKLALNDAQSQKMTLAQVLVEKGITTEDVLARGLAKFHQLEFKSGPLESEQDIIAQFPVFTLRRYRVIPLSKTESQVIIATASPGNFLATDEIRRLTRLEVKVVVTTESAITAALNQLTNDSPGQTSPKVESGPTNQTPQISDEVLNSTASHTDQILSRCISRAASDIHFEPQLNFAIIRERIDGILYEVERLPLDQFAPMLSRLKLLSGMDIVEKRLAQDGRFKYVMGENYCEIRSSTLPTIYGEKLVLRLLRADKSDPTLEMLDIGNERLQVIHQICHLPDGLVLVAGPTGCGKTTTIYAILSRLDRRGSNLIMVEDPVEYEMSYANQVQINAKIGVTFDSILPFILRQDPDILMVGEIRDEATTQMVMRAAISGHLVFSTIHAPNAIQTVLRLLDMGVEPHMVVGSLQSCISQRLLRRLCKYCKKSHEASIEDKRLLGVDEKLVLKIFTEGGCEKCHYLGYSGRFAVMEILTMSDAYRDAILKNDQKVLESVAKAQGFKTLRQHAAERVIAGETTIKELIANCSSL